MKIFLESMKKFRVLWIFVLIILVLSLVANSSYESRQKLVYHESLDMVIASVYGEEITLREFAVYVAFQEEEVQNQAIVYNSEDTRKYWNTHLNGEFISITARNTAMDMAIHDELFYQLSLELKIGLSEDEQTILNNDVEDFWSDLVDEEKEKKLGISKTDVYDSFYKIACAQKAQFVYAGMHGVKYDDYNFNEEVYASFLEKYEYKVEEKVLERLNFGDITLEHSR